MSVALTEVGGVPVLHLRRDTTVCSGGIVFRVGWADENLSVRGLTHLVGHLALVVVAPSEVHHHLETHANHTVLRAEGTAEDVVRLLGEVCVLLGDPPQDRLEGEKAVLAAESRTMYGEGGTTQRVRYGARGYGLSSYPELGVSELDTTLASLWVRETFTRGNAVAWFCGPAVPETLAFPLGDGPLHPPPTATSALPATPAWYQSAENDTVLVTAVLPRSRSARVFAEVLDRLATERLRDRSGYCYQTRTRYVVRDGSRATIVLRADARPERRGAVPGEIVDLLAHLRWGELDEDLVAGAAAAVGEALAAQSEDPTGLLDRARDLLFGVEGAESGALEYEDGPVGVDDVRAAATTFWRTALAQVPDGGLDWAGWHAAPVQSAAAVVGRSHTGHGVRTGESLIVGPEGVTRKTRTRVTTVLFTELACMISFADGGRWLIGTDGIEVRVEPSLDAVGAAVIAEIDLAVDRARVVRRDARHPEDLPGPHEGTEPPPQASTVLGRSRIGGLLRGRGRRA